MGCVLFAVVRGGEKHAVIQVVVGVFDVEMVRHVCGVGNSCEMEDLEATLGLAGRRVLCAGNGALAMLRSIHPRCSTRGYIGLAKPTAKSY